MLQITVEHYQLTYRVLSKCTLLLINISHNSRHVKYFQYIINEQHTKIMSSRCVVVLMWGGGGRKPVHVSTQEAKL